MAKPKTKKADRAKKLKAREQKKTQGVVRFRQKQAHSREHFKLSPTDGYEFWLLHGANFLVSSYEEGLWEPLFPEIYDGKTVSRADMFRRLFRDHLDPKTNQLTPAGTRVVSWASLKPDQMYNVVYRARALARKNGGDPFAPGQPDVWDFLNVMLSVLITKLDSMGNTDGGKFSFPTGDHGDMMPELVAHTIGLISGVES